MELTIFLDGARDEADSSIMPKQIVVFHQHGCPACANYLPRFKRKAVKYRAFVTIKTANLSGDSKKILDAADRYKINVVPITLVLDANDAVLKRVEGSISDKEITELLEFAAKP